jgi:hypothetical protein
LLRGDHLYQGHLYARVLLAKLADETREVSAIASNEETDGQATLFAVPRTPDRLDGFVSGVKRSAGTLEEEFALGSQTDLPLGSVEERSTNFFFQVAHLLTDRTLRYMQRTRGAAESSGCSDGDEVLEMTQFHN